LAQYIGESAGFPDAVDRQHIARLYVSLPQLRHYTRFNHDAWCPSPLVRRWSAAAHFGHVPITAICVICW